MVSQAHVGLRDGRLRFFNNWGIAMPYTVGLDYGTNSVRCLIVNITNGQELGTSVHEYETGQAGLILDSADHNLARQNPADYLKELKLTEKSPVFYVTLFIKRGCMKIVFNIKQPPDLSGILSFAVLALSFALSNWPSVSLS